MSKASSLALSRAKRKAEKLLKAKRLPEALAAYREFCQQAPQDHSSWLILGKLAAQLGDPASAEQAWLQALAIKPEFMEAHRLLAPMYAKHGHWVRAEPHYRACLASESGSVELVGQLAICLEAQGKTTEAAEFYRQQLASGARNATACLGLGRCLRNLGQDEKAAAMIDEALALQADLALAHFEQAQLLRQAQDYPAAIDALQRFIELEPRERESYLLSLAAVYSEQEQYEQALACYDELLKTHPQSAQAHWSRSLLLLGLGRWQEGWQAFEWRRQYPDWRRQVESYATLAPVWQGESLSAKRILVFAEQGFGDTLQFCRYLPALVEQGAEVSFHCQPELIALMDRFDGVTSLTRDVQQPPAEPFDYYLPLMSLPGRLGLTSESLPQPQPYLQADEERVAHWRQALVGSDLKLGLVWAGAAINPSNRRRSYGLSTYAPIINLAGLECYSLQLDPSSADKRSASWQGLTDLAPQIKDFADTAAIIANLDLVITADTAVAHLAGAMGKPVWVLIYAAPDWRWQQDGECSRWYPQMRLFRQQLGESWDTVAARVAAALGAELQTRGQ